MHKVSLGIAALGIMLLLALAGCGTDSHVSGRVTSTNTWISSYPCGKSTCFTTHHTFVVDGQEYQDDWDDVRTGDVVSFDYNTAWGVSNMQDGTVHHDDYSWVPGLILGAVVIGIIGFGAVMLRRTSSS